MVFRLTKVQCGMSNLCCACPRHLISSKSSRAINRGHLEEELAVRAACALRGALQGPEGTVVEEKP